MKKLGRAEVLSLLCNEHAGQSKVQVRRHRFAGNLPGPHNAACVESIRSPIQAWLKKWPYG
jgi:hypothetical protein